MSITVPGYNRKTDRHQFGTLIGISSESAERGIDQEAIEAITSGT
jgi:hypothetical protein